MFQDICVPDFIVKPEDIEYLRGYYQMPGVYILFHRREPLYVGKSGQIYYRLRSHLLGNSKNTSEFISCIDEIGLHFTFDIDYTEMAYITEYNPPYNIRRSKYLLSNQIIKWKYQIKCNATFDNPNASCTNTPHINGYCAWHGGNGIKIQDVADKEAEKIMREDIQLKFII